MVCQQKNVKMYRSTGDVSTATSPQYASLHTDRIILLLSTVWLLLIIVHACCRTHSHINTIAPTSRHIWFPSSYSHTYTYTYTPSYFYSQLFTGCWGWAVSMPGREVASFRKRALILNPAFALVSMNMIPSLEALSSPSSTDTCRFSEASVLLPTRTIMTSLPRSLRTSSIHLEVFRKEARSGRGGERRACVRVWWMLTHFGHTGRHISTQTRTFTYLWCHIPQLPPRSLGCRRESGIGTAPGLPCPRVVDELCGPPST